VGVGGEGEAVAGIVVAAFGVLVNVGSLDDVTFGRFQLISGEGAGELIATGDTDLETTVTALFLCGLEGVGVLPELVHLGGIRNG